MNLDEYNCINQPTLGKWQAAQAQYQAPGNYQNIGIETQAIGKLTGEMVMQQMAEIANRRYNEQMQQLAEDDRRRYEERNWKPTPDYFAITREVSA